MLDVNQLPLYNCHKQVRAMKISSIERTGAGALFGSEGTEPLEVDQQYLAKHTPAVGGYFVLYEDGYQSYSPAAPFESGYALAGPEPEPKAEPQHKGPELMHKRPKEEKQEHKPKHETKAHRRA